MPPAPAAPGQGESGGNSVLVTAQTEHEGMLHVSPLTAKTHISRIMTKLDLHDRAQLVIAAYETGLITPGGR
jgi:hypothetical protein